MAEAKLQNMLSSITGAPKKGGTVFRQKHHRINGTNRTIVGKQEVYEIANPRSLTKHPKTEGELRNQNKFAQTVQRVKAEMADPERLEAWQQRFLCQLDRPEAGNQKSYRVLRAFIQAMILKEEKP